MLQPNHDAKAHKRWRQRAIEGDEGFAHIAIKPVGRVQRPGAPSSHDLSQSSNAPTPAPVLPFDPNVGCLACVDERSISFIYLRSNDKVGHVTYSDQRRTLACSRKLAFAPENLQHLARYWASEIALRRQSVRGAGFSFGGSRSRKRFSPLRLTGTRNHQRRFGLRCLQRGIGACQRIFASCQFPPRNETIIDQQLRLGQAISGICANGFCAFYILKCRLYFLPTCSSENRVRRRMKAVSFSRSCHRRCIAGRTINGKQKLPDFDPLSALDMKLSDDTVCRGNQLTSFAFAIDSANRRCQIFGSCDILWC
jgi:hypothetical protein